MNFLELKAEIMKKPNPIFEDNCKALYNQIDKLYKPKPILVKVHTYSYVNLFGAIVSVFPMVWVKMFNQYTYFGGFLVGYSLFLFFLNISFFFMGDERMSIFKVTEKDKWYFCPDKVCPYCKRDISYMDNERFPEVITGCPNSLCKRSYVE